MRVHVYVDGQSNRGVVRVTEGELAGTLSDSWRSGLRQAIKLMNGKKIEKNIVLGTKTITKGNASGISNANGIAI